MTGKQGAGRGWGKTGLLSRTCVRTHEEKFCRRVPSACPLQNLLSDRVDQVRAAARSRGALSVSGGWRGRRLTGLGSVQSRLRLSQCSFSGRDGRMSMLNFSRARTRDWHFLRVGGGEAQLGGGDVGELCVNGGHGFDGHLGGSLEEKVGACAAFVNCRLRPARP